MTLRLQAPLRSLPRFVDLAPAPRMTPSLGRTPVYIMYIAHIRKVSGECQLNFGRDSLRLWKILLFGMVNAQRIFL